MTKILLTRISKLEQYDTANKTVLWEDPTDTRWNSVYGQLQINDNAIFIAIDKLLIGTVTQINNGQSLLCSNIQEVICSNDQFLQLHEIYPELISRVKANFQPFIHPQQVNITQLINDAVGQRFVSYYILSSDKKYDELKSSFNVNDRVVLINPNAKLDNVKLHTSTGLNSFPISSSVTISVQGLSLNEILEKNKSIKRKSAKSNNVTRIQNIIKSTTENGSYKFNTFFSYYDCLYNKKVYGDGNSSEKSILKITLKATEIVFKVSMSGKDIGENAFNYFNEKNLVIVHSNTKAKGTSYQTQGDTFSKQMKVGDYFYLCRGNSNLEVIGKITSDAEECEFDDFGDEGWLQRSYEIISEAENEGSYQDEKKWWTPNDNSTCIAIPKHEIEDANKKIFIPFFNSQFKYENSMPPESIDNKSNNFMSSTLNQILFGPPGTGKTYNTINKSVAIANPDFDINQSRTEIKKEFDKLIKEGLIVFTTFHQSMSYEDFIEGIKPIEPKVEGQPVIYKVIPGILKELCERIKNLEKLTGNNPETIISVSNFDELYSAFINKLKEIISELEENETHSFESRRSRVKLIKIENDNKILTTGETANSPETITKEKLERIYNKFSSPDEITNIVKQLREVGTDIGWTTNYYAVFRALKEYESSIRTIKDKDISTKTKQNFVLIIDEVNRGNVSQIFGELITLIEEDKRLGADEALEVTLPYSKDRFGVPPNLYIVGTMNTADRSVEALDAALRRRFSFEEMLPKPELIANVGKLKSTNGFLDNIDLPLLLNTINKRIEKLLDKDHQIGHSYFMLVKNYIDLKSAFQNKIIPLLQEYFFGDYGKIGLVIGKEFFERIEKDDENLFADFEDYDASSFAERTIFKIKDIDNMPKESFYKAINSLMKN
jgi:5-methylcytosine-specific restriction endonuclease McrBC GTP-binding regulatory subunit McrB